MSGKQLGHIYLVGAGPGDPDLLTIKALKILESADVILYDKLVNIKILDKANKGARKVFVGKQYGKVSTKQDSIHQMLLGYVKEHKVIVRLKGGDPFIFGRGGEELKYLSENNISVEIIPGITAAFSAAASLKASLTHRILGQSVIFLSGYSKDSSDIQYPLPSYDWFFLANQSLTLVFYMALSNMSHIAHTLVAHGKPASTTAAVVSDCSLPGEKTVVSTLKDIAHEVRKHNIRFPAILLIGDTFLDSQYHNQHNKKLEINRNILFILLFHGSRYLEKNKTILANIIQQCKQQLMHDDVDYAFLSESFQPSLKDTITKYYKQNPSKHLQIEVLPIFLLPGKHTQEDIPDMLDILKTKFKPFDIRLGSTINFKTHVMPILINIIKQKYQ